MKKIVTTLVFVLFCTLCLAQSQFKSYLINGDVKMKEQFYEMAISYYNKAKSVATTEEELALAEKRIAECYNLLNPKEEEQETLKPKSKILFTDQYLESGDLYSMSKKEVIPSEEGSEMTLYKLEVHPDCLVVVSHTDDESEMPIDFIPSGTVIPLAAENSEYRRFSSDKAGEEFIVYKKVLKNEFGNYHVVLRKESGNYLKLYSTAELRQLINEIQNPPSESVSKDKTQTQTQTDKPVKILPITFTEGWYLNLDEDGFRLADSRSEQIWAKDVRWLTIRLRYTCPDNYDNPARFDVKIIDPKGKLMGIPGKGVEKGFSTYEMLETIPAGGIFNIAIGSDNPGSFISGKYIISIWYDNVQYYSLIVELL